MVDFGDVTLCVLVDISINVDAMRMGAQILVDGRCGNSSKP